MGIGKIWMLKFGSPTITLSPLVQNCTVKVGCTVVDSLSLVSVFHLLVNSFSGTSFRTFLKTPYLLYSGGRGGIKMASANTQSANEPARTSL